MTSPVTVPTATLVVHADTDLSIPVDACTVRLDEAWSPYVQADVTIPTPATATLNKLDPRLGYRAELTLGQSWLQPTRAAQSRTFNLILHARKPDFTTGTTALTLRSDEALLVDAGLVATTPNTAQWANEASLRAIVNSILGTYAGGALAAGTDDADFTRTATATNYITNGKVGADTTNWDGQSAGHNAARNTSGGPTAALPAFYRMQLTTASNPFYLRFGNTTPVPLSAGKTYIVSAWVRSNTAQTIYIDVVGSGLDSPNNPVALAANTWTRVASTPFLVPTGTTGGAVRIIHDSSSMPVGTTLDATGLLLTESTGVHDTDYWDGAVGDTTHYTLAWTGSANASSSTRTRLDSRSVDALTFQPGVKAWDFLNPLVQAAGMRLFCDESRIWRLVKQNSYLLDQMLSIAVAQNLTAGSESIDRGGEWATGVVVKYTWNDSAGLAQTAYDAAGTGSNVMLVENASPYPGAGAAAVILARMQGRGRTLDLPALADLAATPGQLVQATIPNADVQTGVVSAASFSWPDTLMQIGTRALIDTPAGAWILAPDTTWDGTADAVTWDTYA